MIFAVHRTVGCSGVFFYATCKSVESADLQREREARERERAAVEREISVRDRERDLEERVIQLILERERSMMISSGVHIGHGHSSLMSGWLTSCVWVT